MDAAVPLSEVTGRAGAGYNNCWIDHLFALVSSQTVVKEFLATFKEFPPSQRPAKFNVEDALNSMMKATNN